MPRVALLVADDVGLGKTIEAGLVVQEMLLRHRARRVLVVCPASLTLKWRDEMREKFGLSFNVLDADALRVLRRTHGLLANPFTVYPRNRARTLDEQDRTARLAATHPRLARRAKGRDRG
jgi:SNF2 family DNA or RNA helicase